MVAAKKAPARKARPATRPATPAPVAKKATAKKATVQATAKKTPAKKAPAKQTPAKKTPANQVAKKTPAKRAPAETMPTKSTAVKKAAPTKSTAVKKAAAKQAPAKQAPAAKTTRSKAAGPSDAIRGWTAAELRAAGKTLEADLAQLRSEYEETMVTLTDMQQTVSDGSGDDQADAGSKTFEREHEMSLANNRLDLITQIEHALVRIADGSYGRCESCGEMIAKARLQAFPGATLCLTCKQREERR